MAKPRVLTRCVANTYTSYDERIIEFSDQETPCANGGPTGGLISFRRTKSDSRLLVAVYALDGPIDIAVQQGTPVYVNGTLVAGEADAVST